MLLVIIPLFHLIHRVIHMPIYLHKHRLICCVIVTLALLLPALLHAQQPDPRTTGATYILAFPDTTTNKFDANLLVVVSGNARI